MSCELLVEVWRLNRPLMKLSLQLERLEPTVNKLER